MNDRVFFDTNVLLYLLSTEARKADRAESLLAGGGVVSIQVLNEIVSVCTRKLRMPWAEVDVLLAAVRSSCRVEPLTEATHDLGRNVAERYRLSVYDAMIVAAALLTGADELYSEDLQDGMQIDGGLTIRNPFRSQVR